MVQKGHGVFLPANLGKKREQLCGDFVRLAAQRAGAGDGEGHLPEISDGVCKFQADHIGTIAFPLHIDDVHFCGAIGVFINDEQRLSDNQRLVHLNQSPLLVQGTGGGSITEFLAHVIGAMHK